MRLLGKTLSSDLNPVLPLALLTHPCLTTLQSLELPLLLTLPLRCRTLTPALTLTMILT